MIQLQIENAKKEIKEQITKISNNYKLDYYFLFGILKETLLEIEIGMNKEIEDLKKQENSSKKESDN